MTTPIKQQEVQKLERQVQAVLRKVLPPEMAAIAAISGGPDSIFLLHFLQKHSKKLIVAHVDHKLRQESKKEAIFVKTLTENIPNAVFETISADIKKLSEEKKQGIEATGREVRYDFFKKLAEKYQTPYIITAHHADDNLETVILNLARGASIQGLQGMQEKEELVDCKILLRPLINISKTEILNYLKFKKLSYQEDESNQDTQYQRNHVRLNVVPELLKINPALAKTLAKNSQNLRETNEYLSEEAQKWLQNNENTANKINAKDFLKTPKILQKNIIREIYKKYVGNTQNLESIHIDEILNLIEKNVGNKEKKLGPLAFSLKNNVVTFKKN